MVILVLLNYETSKPFQGPFLSFWMMTLNYNWLFSSLYTVSGASLTFPINDNKIEHLSDNAKQK